MCQAAISTFYTENLHASLCKYLQDKCVIAGAVSIEGLLMGRVFSKKPEVQVLPVGCLTVRLSDD